MIQRPLEAWQARELSRWQSGGKSAFTVRRDIQYHKRQLRKFTKRLKEIREYLDGLTGEGTDELAEWRAEKLEREVAYYICSVAFYEWLSKQ